jgi:hypothetical protein
MRTLILTGALLLFAGSALTAAAADGTRVEMQILDNGQPVVGSRVTIFMSCDKLEGTTGDDGRVVLESATCQGKHYWLEIDGQRVNTLFQVENSARSVDLDNVSFMTWQGGR